MLKGKISRKVCTHGPHADVISLAWSPSGRYLVSGDDMGKIIAKKLRLKEDGKWAVYPVFEAWIADDVADEVADQFLFSPDETLLLISTRSRDQIWDLASRTLALERTRSGDRSGQWINDPFDDSRLLFVEQNRVHIHNWRDFEKETTLDIITTDPTDQAEEATPRPSDITSTDKVQALSTTHSRRFIVHQTSPEPWNMRSKTNRGRNQINLLLAADLQGPAPTPKEQVRRRSLPELSARTQLFLGTYREKIIFIDHQNWLCSSDISWNGKAAPDIRRHYFLPRDWLGSEATMQLIRFTEQGVLLVPRNGEVAIVRYGRAF